MPKYIAPPMPKMRHAHAGHPTIPLKTCLTTSNLVQTLANSVPHPLQDTPHARATLNVGSGVLAAILEACTTLQAAIADSSTLLVSVSGAPWAFHPHICRVQGLGSNQPVTIHFACCRGLTGSRTVVIAVSTLLRGNTCTCPCITGWEPATRWRPAREWSCLAGGRRGAPVC